MCRFYNSVSVCIHPVCVLTACAICYTTHNLPEHFLQAVMAHTHVSNGAGLHTQRQVHNPFLPSSLTFIVSSTNCVTGMNCIGSTLLSAATPPDAPAASYIKSVFTDMVGLPCTITAFMLHLDMIGALQTSKAAAHLLSPVLCQYSC